MSQQFLKDEIELLYAASNKLTQASTPAESLEAVSDYARENGAARGVLFYTDSASSPTSLEVVAEWVKGKTPPLGVGTRFEIPRNLLNRVTASANDRPILVPDVLISEALDDVNRDLFSHYHMLSTAILPLHINDRWVGVMLFAWDRSYLFDEHEQRILTALIQQSSPVIDSMRLFEQTQRRASELEIANNEMDILYSSSHLLTRAQTNDELLAAVSAYALDCGANSGVLFFVEGGEQAPDSLVVMAQWDTLPDAANRGGERYRLSSHTVNQIWLSNPTRPELISDMLIDERLDAATRAFYASLNIRATVILPLNNRGRWVGMIAFNWRDPHQFNERDQRVFTALIQQAAPAIDALRLLETSRERAERAELLLEINTALSRAANEAEILNAIALYTECQSALGLTLNYLDIDDEGNPTSSRPVAIWRDGAAALYDPEVHYIVPLSKFGIATLWINQPEQVLLIEDIASYEWITAAARTEMLDLMKTRALALLPLHAGGRYQGVLSILWFEPHVFTEQEKYVYNVLMQTLPSVVATRRAYLSEEAAREETELLYQAGEAINAATTFQEMAEAVAHLDISLHSIVLTAWQNFDFEGAEYFEIIATAKGGNYQTGQRFSVADFPVVAQMPHKGLFIVEDMNDDARIDSVSASNWAKFGTFARIGVALSLNNRWIGNLAFQSDKPRRYTARDKRLVAGMGDLVSAALERIRLQAETEVARQRAETLAMVNAALSQAKTEWDILAAVGLYTCQIEPANMALHYLYSDETGIPITMSVEAAWEYGEPAPNYPTLGHIYDMRDSSSMQLVINNPKHALMIEDLNTDPRIAAPLRELMIKRLRHQALVVIPLFSSGGWQGTIGLAWNEPRRFTDNDRRICEALIQTVGAVVASRRSYLAAENARRENEQRARELETVAKVSAAAATLQGVDDLLNTVAQLTTTNFNLYHVQVYLYDETTHELILAPDNGEHIRLEDEQFAAAQAGNMRRIVIRNRAEEIDHDLRLPETAAQLAVPLVVGDKLIGVMDIRARESSRFGSTDALVMSTLADQIAVAVQNARLYAQAQELAVLEERNRLARELHDSVSQALYGIALGTRTARTLLDRDPKLVAEPLDYVLSLAEAGLTEMRALIFELRPEALRNEGLIAALTKQAASLQARHGIQVETDLCVEPEIRIEIKEALYQIAREAMHNTVKHARASRVMLTLQARPDALVLDLRDDGIGFDTGESFPGHLGLHSMRERALRLKGTITLESTPGFGTHIAVTIPVT
ncbi:MAG: GAF domain-containing protein [Anaerolinea sp.]|nr:GAF domain-containing protein [Anaerolinea sp.]